MKSPAERFDIRIYQGIQSLASVCDGAVQDDKRGFNGGDSRVWKWQAIKPMEDWYPDTWIKAYKTLRKYRGQLSGFGIDYDDIVAPKMKRDIHRGRKGEFTDRIIFDFDFVAVIKDDLKNMGLTKLRFDMDLKVWHCEPTKSNVERIREFATMHEFEIKESAEEFLTAIENGTWNAPEKNSPTSPLPEQERTIDFIKGKFALQFPYDGKLKDEIKSEFANRKYQKDWNGLKNVWLINPSTIKDFDWFKNWLTERNFKISESTSRKMDDIASTRTDLFEFSNREDSDFFVDGLKLTPYPFQAVGMEFATKLGGGLIADQPGLGKTIQAVGSVRKRMEFPAVVISPANIKIKWAREIQKWTDHTVFIIHSKRIRGFKDNSGKLTPEVINDIKNGKYDFIVINYELIFRHDNVKKIRQFNPPSIILDEVHYLANSEAKRTQEVETLVSGWEFPKDEKGKKIKGSKPQQVHQGIEHRYLLTGTPILNRPAELIAPLRILGVFNDLFPAQDA